MLLLGDILRRHARVRGGKTAYVVGERRVTYRDFHAESNRLARALQRLGVGRGDRVAMLANNCAEVPPVYFAALRLGAIVVPINARFAPTEILHVAANAEPVVLLVTRELAEPIDRLRDEEPFRRIRHRIWIGEPPVGGEPSLAALVEGESADDVDVFVDELDPHVMLHTSGTTGAPKGVLLSHRSYYLQAMAAHVDLGLCEEDVGLSMFPMFHMGGWALPLGFWRTGGTAVILPKAEPRALLAAVERERVTYLYAVPTVFASMLALPDFDRHDLSSLRIIASGTSAMTRDQVLEIMRRFRCRNMFVRYGSTEAGPVSTLRPRDVERKPETVGRPFPEVDVRLVGADGAPVAPGETGEITVRSEFVMQGYWRNAEDTARTLRDGWVFTGDLGVIDEEGFLSIVGRRKEVIRSAGESIFPAEVERVLLEHAAIAEAAVVSLPDPHWGEAVAAAVVLEPGARLTSEEVVEHVRGRLAGFKKPRHVFFLAELPRTAASRQVHKPLLREMLLSRSQG